MQQWESALELNQHSLYWRRVLGVVGQAGMDIVLQKLLSIKTTDLAVYAANLNEIKTYVDDIRQAQNAFCELVELVSKANQNRRIVFLVDNLDRCSPENVVRLLESIKNFLHAPSCVWVFAMDSGVIASYIDHKYEGTRMDGNSYLDKIVPEQYHIPPIFDRDTGQLRRFLNMVHRVEIERDGLPEVDITRIPQIPEVLVPRRLLKTAHKFYEAYTGDLKTGLTSDPQIVFLLILLNNAWPAFYERFSSAKPEHIRGILCNYMDQDKDKALRIPLEEKYTNDRSLRHFLQHCFINQQDLDTLCITLSACMVYLHEVGLP
jgi:hypothetical protein